MIWAWCFEWFELIVFLTLLMMSIYMLSVNEIKQVQKVYVLFHIAMLMWPFGQFSINMTDNLSYQWSYLNVSFIGILMISYLWLLISFFFAQQISRKRKIYMRIAALPPLIIGICISLNPVFEWFAVPIDGSYTYRSYGPLFWALAGMAGLYVFIGCLLLVPLLKGHGGAMKKQALTLIIAQLLLLTLWGVDVLLNWNSVNTGKIFPGLTSAGIILSYFCFVVAVQRYSVYKAVTLAHDSVIDSMESGLVVLSDKNVVIDLNQTAKRFLSIKIGQTFPIERCIDCMDPLDSEDFLYVYTNKPRSSIQAELSSFTPTMQHVLMRIHPIHDRRQRYIGRMIVFQDVTEWRSMVEELNSKNRDLSARNKELTKIQEELYSLNRRLELMATTDSLTGCYNRRHLFQMMEYQINIDRRYQVPFSIILLDIDYFKQTNDTYGHQIGDQVLKQTAELLSSRLRQTDILARYGGEEFLIFLPHTNREYAMTLAEQLRLLVEANEVETERGNIRVTISIGVASSEEVRLTHDHDVKSYILDMIARADAALYQAKNDGRNRIAASQ